MLSPLRTAVLTALLLCATTASAVATPLQVAPATGTTVRTPYPVFSWSVPAGEQNLELFVTPTSKLVDGELVSEDNVASTPAAGATSSAKPTRAYTPGDYFWQLRTDNGSAVSEEFQVFRSPVRRFIVPGVFQFSFLKPVIGTNGANNLSQVQLTGVLRCNMASGTTQSKMSVFRGSRLLHTDTRVVGCFGMSRNVLYHNFQPRPGTIPNGAVLTVKMTAVSGFYKSAVPTVTTVKWHS